MYRPLGGFSNGSTGLELDDLFAFGLFAKAGENRSWNYMRSVLILISRVSSTGKTDRITCTLKNGDLSCIESQLSRLLSRSELLLYQGW